MAEDQPAADEVIGGLPPVEFNVTWPWDAADGAPVVSHMALLGDGTEEGFYLVMGQVAPPPWFTMEARERGAAQYGRELPVHVRAAVHMTRSRAEELYALLHKHLRKDKAND